MPYIFEEEKCPACGEEMSGTADIIFATAYMKKDEDTGLWDYIGESKVYWDTQMTNLPEKTMTYNPATHSGVMQLACSSCGNDWTSRYKEV